jgi:hypothetical protein
MLRFKSKIDKYKKELFYFLAVSLFLFFLLELIFPRFVLAYINLNILVFLFLVIFFYIIFSPFLKNK